MKTLFLTLSIVFAFVELNAQTNVWQPSSGHTQVPIWPGTVPDLQPPAGPEYAVTSKRLVSGNHVVRVYNVSQPTMTVYSPQGKNAHVAVVVFPGGGYNALGIDLEGTEICDRLSSRGITAVLLKYRVPDSGPRLDTKTTRQVFPKSPTALEDAQRTVGLVRFHAADLGIDPHKIGVIGFSAGGHLVADISTHFDTRLYPAVDAADNESCRPDFAIACYPELLWIGDKNFGLNPDIPVTTNTPPTFIVQAEDDHEDGVYQSVVYYMALKNAGVPTEMHLYAHGGHGFGSRPTENPITDWPQLVETWLATIGMTSN